MQHIFWCCLIRCAKYEMDLASIVEDTERTQFCPQTDRQTNRRTDRQTDGEGETSIPPFNFVEVEGINIHWIWIVKNH